MTEEHFTNKPVTKYITLKITYNSFYVDSPETWNWNNLIDCYHDENAEVIKISDSYP